jgi:hypothetical protein
MQAIKGLPIWFAVSVFVLAAWKVRFMKLRKRQRDQVWRRLPLMIMAVAIAPAWATPQMPDNFDLDGVRMYSGEGPLESARSADPALWDRLKPLLPQATCTALWRAHIANWEIKDRELRLVSLVASDCGRGTDIALSTLFPNQVVPVTARWFTGTLKLYHDTNWKCGVLEKCSMVRVSFEQGKMIGKPEQFN